MIQAGRRSDPPPKAAVLGLDSARIARALRRRERYKYVRPRVEREGTGWKIVSPNCSRNVDPDGGEIDIAWLVPDEAGRWLLHARDHEHGCWVLKATGVTLEQALEQVRADPLRQFWI